MKVVGVVLGLAMSAGGSRVAGGASLEPLGFKAVQLAVGARHSCALTGQGEVVCWGAGKGVGDCAKRFECGQSRVPEGRYKQVTAADNYTCALTTEGSAVCWGTDELRGSFGRTVPARGAFTQISAGVHHVCGIRAGGRVECWGAGQGVDGKVVWNKGQGRPYIDLVATRVAAGSLVTCAIKADESGLDNIACWGIEPDRNAGPYPRGPYTSLALSHRTKVLGCVVGQKGRVECWGAPLEQRRVGGEFTQVSVEASMACGVRTNGQLYCWGVIPLHLRAVPAGVFKQVAVGTGHVCAIAANDSVVCWGDGEPGRHDEEDMGQADPPVTPELAKLGAAALYEKGTRYLAGKDYATARALFALAERREPGGAALAVFGEARAMALQVDPANDRCMLAWQHEEVLRKLRVAPMSYREAYEAARDDAAFAALRPYPAFRKLIGDLPEDGDGIRSMLLGVGTWYGELPEGDGEADMLTFSADGSFLHVVPSRPYHTTTTQEKRHKGRWAVEGSVLKLTFWDETNAKSAFGADGSITLRGQRYTAYSPRCDEVREVP